MNKKYKIPLSILGAIVTTASPIAALISCDKTTQHETTNTITKKATEDMTLKMTSLKAPNIITSKWVFKNIKSEKDFYRWDFSNVVIIGEYAFNDFHVLPDHIKFPKLKIIGDYAFYNLTIMPNEIDFSNVTTIGNWSFYNLNKLPDKIDFSNVTNIGSVAFYSLTALPKEIKFTKLRTILDLAFIHLNTLPKEIQLPKLITIGNLAFRGLTKLNQLNDGSSEVAKKYFNNKDNFPLIS